MRIHYCTITHGYCRHCESATVQEDTFFLAEPLYPGEERIKREDAVRTALEDGFDERCSDRLRVADTRESFCDSCVMIQTSAYGIVDISGLDPYVLIELGMLMALEKPVVVLVKNSEEHLLERLPFSSGNLIVYNGFSDMEKKLSTHIQHLQPCTGAIQRRTYTPGDKVDMSSVEKKIDDIYAKLEQIGKLVGFSENPEVAVLGGNWHYHREEYEKALELYGWAATLNPDSYRAWYGKGVVLGNLGQHTKAVESFDRALQIKEDFAEAWYNRGVALLNGGQHTKAVESFDRALQIKEDFTEAWVKRGVALDQCDMYAEALQSFERALEVREDADAWYGKGVVFGKCGKFEEAVASFEKAVKVKDDYTEAWYGKGVALGNIGKHTEAVESFDRALHIREDAQAWANRGVSLHELGKYEEAVASFDKALELKEDFVEAWANKGISFHKLAQYKKAQECYEEALKINPDVLSVLENYSEALLAWGNVPKGLKMAEKALERAEEMQDKTVSWFLCISAYMLKGDKKGEEELKRFMNYLKEHERELGVIAWDFSHLLPAMEDRLNEKDRKRMLSIVAFLKGEISLEEVERTNM